MPRTKEDRILFGLKFGITVPKLFDVAPVQNPQRILDAFATAFPLVAEYTARQRKIALEEGVIWPLTKQSRNR